MRPQELAKLLQELDAALKKVAGTCEKCGKPKGGFVPAFVLVQCGGDKKRVGLCVCSDAPQTEGR
jgi:hypothetical protein